VTPNDRHSGRSKVVLAQRRQVYAQAKALNPSRWSRDIRRWGEPPMHSSEMKAAEDPCAWRRRRSIRR